MKKLSTNQLASLKKRQHGFKGENSDVLCHEGDSLNRRQRRRLAAIIRKGDDSVFSIPFGGN